jgi:translocation and assembly module TamA
MKKLFKISYPCFLVSLLLPLLNPTMAFGTDKPKALYADLHINWTNLPKPIDDNIHSAIENLVSNLNQNKTVLPNAQLNQLISKTMREAMMPYGYFSPTITITDQHKTNAWIIDAAIDKNNPIIVRHVTIRINNPTAAWQKIASSFPLKKGDILTTASYSDYKDSLYDLASSLGYFDANLNTSTITINRKDYWADIDISFSPNTRYTYGDTSIHTNYLNTHFLQRYIPYKNGEFFDSKTIQSLQNTLQNTQYFSYLEVLPQSDKKSKTVHTQIYSTTAKKFHYILGIGYGTDTGARGTIGVQIIPLNKRGHTFQIMTKLAMQYSLINGTYVIPGKDPLNTQYNLFTQLNQYNLSLGSAMASEVGAGYHHIYHLWRTIKLTQIMQVYQLNETSIYTGQPKNNQTMAIGSIQYTIGPPLTSLNVGQAFQWSVGVLSARKGLGSLLNFTQYNSSISYIKLIHNTWRLALGNEWAMSQIKNLYDIPLSLQLMTGGSNSIQGYSYGSIGPGKYLSIGNIALQRQIWQGWFLGGFYDVGSVSDGFVKDLKQSAGPCLTLSTPMGGLTFSIAKPIDDITQNHWSFSFSWGATL